MALPLFNIGGLASGLDTNSIIDQLMQVERIPIQQLEARKATYQAKDDAWQEINTRLSALRTAMSPLDGATDLAAFATATSSNEDAVSVAATGAASPGTLSFTVDALAANHQIISDTSFAGASALVGAGDFTITVDGVDHVITANAATTLSDLAQQINDLSVGVKAAVVAVDASTSKIVLSADQTGAASEFTAAGTMASLADFSVSQQAADAELTLGSGAGAVTVYRSTNSITDLVGGVTIDLHATTASAVTVAVDHDVDAAAAAVQSFVDEMNALLDKIGEHTAYNAESQVGGVLAGDATARQIVTDLRAAVSGTVNEASGEYAVASSIGISLNRTGTFEFDSAKLRAALENDFAAVGELLAESGHAVDTRLGFVSATGDTLDGSYEVIVTQAAANPSVTGTKYKKPNSDVTFQILIGSVVVDVTVFDGDNVDEAIDAINTALAGEGVTTLTASKVQVGGKDAIQLDDTRFGSAPSFEVIGDEFGLSGTHVGVDVAGTIGGEVATGVGRHLTATAGDPDGLKVKVTATQAEVDGAGGSLSLGDVIYSAGVMGALDAALEEIEGADGSIERARDRWQSQIDLIDDRIEVYEDRLDRREAALLREFAALEVAMSSLSTQAAWLAAQLPGLTAGTGL